MSIMNLATISYIALLSSGLAIAQTSATSTAQASLAPQTILPITFSKALSAKRVKPGDAIQARTVQQVRLANGQVVGRGAQVLGHVVAAQPFVFDRTPYAKQKQGVLAIQFDTLVSKDGNVPLHVSVRAIADSFATEAAVTPGPSDDDPLHSTTQVGGDITSPFRNEITSSDGDTVGYNKRGGTFAHLIANGRCDASNNEQPISIFSASACGAYGFRDLAVATSGTQVTLSSTHRTPEIPRYSSALLEVVSGDSVASAAE